MSEIIVPEGDESVSLPKKQYDEMVEKLANKTQSESNLISEIKELREKKQITEAEAEDLRKKLAERGEPETPKEVTPETVEEIAKKALAAALAEKDTEAAKSAKANALASFIARHKEYHPDNDAGGLKAAVLERKVSQFNLNGLKTEADFLSILEDAHRLAGGSDAPKEQPHNPNPIDPNGTGGAEPKIVTDDKLTPQELKIIDRTFGGDKERYLKIKVKRPDYVETLLQYAL